MMININKPFNKYQGFTLLELLVVMVIIGLLVSIVGPRLFNQISQSEIKTAKAQIDALKKSLDVYRLDTGHYPDQESGLNALLTAPANEPKWQGPYLQKELPLDPWQHAYVYRNPGERGEVDVVSLGADGRPGGEAVNADIQ